MKIYRYSLMLSSFVILCTCVNMANAASEVGRTVCNPLDIDKNTFESFFSTFYGAKELPTEVKWRELTNDTIDDITLFKKDNDTHPFAQTYASPYNKQDNSFSFKLNYKGFKKGFMRNSIGELADSWKFFPSPTRNYVDWTLEITRDDKSARDKKILIDNKLKDKVTHIRMKCYRVLPSISTPKYASNLGPQDELKDGLNPSDNTHEEDINVIYKSKFIKDTTCSFKYEGDKEKLKKLTAEYGIKEIPADFGWSIPFSGRVIEPMINTFNLGAGYRTDQADGGSKFKAFFPNFAPYNVFRLRYISQQKPLVDQWVFYPTVMPEEYEVASIDEFRQRASKIRLGPLPVIAKNSNGSQIDWTLKITRGEGENTSAEEIEIPLTCTERMVSKDTRYSQELMKLEDLGELPKTTDLFNPMFVKFKN